uniref:Uncharacterized protein n=1 Tax=Anguilla anguilla TaxID=7936 RepID=A0A0E9UZ14_ANGAN
MHSVGQMCFLRL